MEVVEERGGVGEGVLNRMWNRNGKLNNRLLMLIDVHSSSGWKHPPDGCWMDGSKMFGRRPEFFHWRRFLQIFVWIFLFIYLFIKFFFVCALKRNWFCVLNFFLFLFLKKWKYFELIGLDWIGLDWKWIVAGPLKMSIKIPQEYPSKHL